MIIALIHICRGNFLFLVPHFSVSSFRFFSLILRTLAFFDEIRCIHLCLYFIFGSICCMFFPCCFSCCLFLFSYYSFHWFLIPFRNSQSHLSILRSFSEPLRRKTLLVAPICFLRISIALLWIVSFPDECHTPPVDIFSSIDVIYIEEALSFDGSVRLFYCYP